MEEVWMEVHQQNEPASHRQGVGRGAQTARRREKHGSARQGKDLEKRNGRLSPGEEITTSACVLPFENGLVFFNKQKFREEKVSECPVNGSYVD